MLMASERSRLHNASISYQRIIELKAWFVGMIHAAKQVCAPECGKANKCRRGYVYLFCREKLKLVSSRGWE
ncbi:hypothetical protein ACJIZ3_018004 [Penstemon smallii]|uniref:Uncharacterized protein n=1 Tax=Penstemon smallii TaxID=265156 RepID=A0ABD3SX44_9LAMI